MGEARYIIGIDLGTSNCAVAFVDVTRGAEAPVVDFPIFQAIKPSEKGLKPLLPSAIYLAGEHELAPEVTKLPWAGKSNSVVGEFALWQGSRIPGRLVTSAKSWLCHPRVDRMAGILPWGAPEEVRRISPVEASALFLQHMVSAWDHAHPEAPAHEQDVVVTVPASFDEVARALTVNAARKAGLEKFTLLEEPQAAFYDFTARHRKDLARPLEGVSLVLVIDVGGGTSDFTLVQIGVSAEGPLLKRIAVGEHLMLGGDNMDAALARKLETDIAAKRGKLTASQWNQLLQGSRLAKETLLGKYPPGHHNISIVAEGSRLLGGAISWQVKRDEVEAAVLEGFFPTVPASAQPRKGARGGIQELGLPYAQDPAVTTHVAAFLRHHAQAGFNALGLAMVEGAIPRPDAILLNGGVFNSGILADRLLDVISSWWPARPRIPLLHHESLELAVARGAAYYGLARRGLGRRIGGGAAHAFYVGLGQGGDKRATSALCIIPRGHEEAQVVELKERSFDLTLGTPVQFPLFSTTEDRVDKPGDIIPLVDDLKPLPPTHTLLKGATDKAKKVPVHLRALLTEIGTLELWCVSNISSEQWRLEFELRAGGSEEMTVTEAMPIQFQEARAAVDHIFGLKLRGPGPAGIAQTAQLPKEVKHLWGALERTLGARDQWRVPILRELWSALYAGKNRRRRTAEHERIFFQLAGFCLRPGFGYPLDGWRCEQMFGLLAENVEFHKEKPVWNEFWIMWRRLAGGLSEEHQRVLWDYLKPAITAKLGHAPKQLVKKGIQPEGLDEMIRTAASLEHLPSSEKAELGDWIADRLKRNPGLGGPWSWSLGRLGARVPIYGSIHLTVSPAQARHWLSLLLKLGPEKIDGAPFAMVQLCRLSGDRTRDLDSGIRTEVLSALAKCSHSPSWLRLINEVVTLEAADEARILGDTLPAGLQLSS